MTKATDLVAIKYTGRYVKWNGNQTEVRPVMKTKARETRDPKTDKITVIPGVPLISIDGPYTRQEALNFLAMRANENSNSPSTWEIVEIADIDKHTDVTQNNWRG
ncbi:hypothetical protein CZP2022_9 [Vibrio phage C-ZP2022]|nr:hypothetical protein CZP2022_9 [Vibrio phage C-ZP2022]